LLKSGNGYCVYIQKFYLCKDLIFRLFIFKMQILKKTIILLLLLFTFLNSKAAENKPETTSDSVKLSVSSPANFSLPDSVINYGKLFLKTPYRYGSKGTNSFDCSGFTSYVYRNFGYNLERTSSDQSKQFGPISRDQLKTGDLVFFEGRRRNGRVGHVGIVVSTNDSGHFDFIHSAVHSGVTISKSNESYYLNRFVSAGRIIGIDTVNRIKGTIPKMTRDEYVSYKPANSVKVSVPAKYHKVKKGENLSIIAEKYGLSVTALKQKNNLANNNLKINQRLKIKNAESYTKAETMLTENPLSVSNKTSENEYYANTIHTIKKGENLISISKLYNVPVLELKNLNNLKNNKVSIGQKLKISDISNQIELENTSDIAKTENTETIPENPIPVSNKTSEKESYENNIHIIKKGENLISISKLYNVSVLELKNLNNLKNNKVNIGQKLKITEISSQIGFGNTSEVAKTENAETIPEKTGKVLRNNDKILKHKIKKGESLYTIAKLHSMSIDELKLLNSLSDSKIKPGQVLLVSQNHSDLKPEKKPSTKNHKVKSGESLYSIAKIYGCTVAELKDLNSKYESNLNVGDILKVRNRD